MICTTSGRIELCPSTFAADVDRLHSALRDPGTSGGTVLIGRRHLRSNNSWLHNVPELVRGSNTCTLQLNPADADALGVTAGDTVRVTSRTGTVDAVAEPTETIMPGVVSLPHGWGHDRPGTRTEVAARHAGRERQRRHRRAGDRPPLRQRRVQRRPRHPGGGALTPCLAPPGYR